jgi:hypothetical protein
VICTGWFFVAAVVVAFWAVTVAATLALFPSGSRSRQRRFDDD